MEDRIGTIGRPDIGDEFIDIHSTDRDGVYGFRRWHQRSSAGFIPQRILNIANLPGEEIVEDLISIIECITKHMDMDKTTYDGLNLDDRGPKGDRPSLRDRLKALSNFGMTD